MVRLAPPAHPRSALRVFAGSCSLPGVPRLVRRPGTVIVPPEPGLAGLTWLDQRVTACGSGAQLGGVSVGIRAVRGADRTIAGVSVVDPRLVRALHPARALHVIREDRDAFDREPDAEHEVWQTSSIDALLDGAYEGDLTLAELCAHGDLGIGTVQHLDGELVVIDGRCFRIDADGSVHEPDPLTPTPFAVVCPFTPDPPIDLAGPLSLAAVQAEIDAVAPDEPVVAVRIDGTFTGAHLRSVPRQEPPYPSLAEVVGHQTEWHVAEVTGSIVGFRFPDEAQGIDVAGYHLHLIADDRTVGGHLIDVTVEHGRLLVDGAHELHLEIPAGVRVGGADTSAAKADAIRRVEGGR